MKVVTAEQIRELDRRAIEESGMPGVVLMENAARAVCDLLQADYGPLAGKRAAVFCGAGNNGGDGFAVFRLLSLAGATVTLFTTIPDLDRAELKPDAAAHLRVILQQSKGHLAEIPDESTDWRKWSDSFDFAVDALLGTGVKDAPRGRYAEAIRAVNALRCPVIAVDIPSGVDADTGGVPGDAVCATSTITFAYPKLGLFLFPGAQYVGKLTVADIGFPWSSLNFANDIFLLEPSSTGSTACISSSPSLRESDRWEKLLQKRRPESNKGDYGHVGVLAGSRGMVGAPALVARAAQRTGAGLVTVLTANSAQPILAGKLDEQMTLPLAEVEGSVAETAWESIVAFAKKATVFCVGPGLTTHKETVLLLHRLLTEIQCAIVLDADGLNALAMRPEAAQERRKKIHSPLILTPHPGEAARLLDNSIAQVQADRVGAVRELALRYQAVAVLKGRHTLIADAGGTVHINTTGNPGMATGGMGDTLTGIIGAILAQDIAQSKRFNCPQVAALDAASLGVHVHGLAGDIVAEERGEAGLTAGDVIDRLPVALSRLMMDV